MVSDKNGVASFNRYRIRGLWDRAKRKVQAFLILPATNEPLLAVEWTLRHGILFYFVFAMATIEKKFGLIFAALWIVGSLAVPHSLPNFPVDFLLRPYHLQFGMGVLACASVKRSSVYKPLYFIAAGAVVFVATWNFVAFEVANRSIFTDLGYGVGATLLIIGLASWERHALFVAPRPMLLLGNASYAIYLVHYPIISALCKAGNLFGVMRPSAFFYTVIAS